MDGWQSAHRTHHSLSLSLTLKSQYSYSLETRRDERGSLSLSLSLSLHNTHRFFCCFGNTRQMVTFSLSLSPLYLLRVCFSENVFARLESHTAVVPVFTFCGLLLPLSHSPLLLPSVCSSDIDRPASYQLVCPIERR